MSRPTTNLHALLAEGADRQEIASFLDELPASQRVEEALSITGSLIGRLYDAVSGGEPLQLVDIVPATAADEATIIFSGRNSLPVHTRFQKRFARLPCGQVVGYNHQSLAFATGHGYFVVKPGEDGSDEPGHLYFDYTIRPEHVPMGWPRYRTNSWGVSRLVYKDMKDYMRSVASGVMVGKAYKLGVAQGAYFLLARGSSGERRVG